MTKSVSFLESLTLGEREALQPHLQERTFASGEQLFDECQQQKPMVFIREGCAKVVVCTGLGRDLITDLLLDGAIFGLLDQQSEMASVVSVTQVQAYVIPRSVFFAVVASTPAILVKALEASSGRYRDHNEALVGLALESASARTCRTLVRLADRVGRRTSRGTELDFSLTRQEFSELIGSTPETATRELSLLRKSGLFFESGNRTILPNLEELRGRSQILQMEGELHSHHLLAAS